MKKEYPISRKGDYAVRINTFGKYLRGQIYKRHSDSEVSIHNFRYSIHCSMSPEDWRHATKEEIKAYNSGIRNIKDIKSKELYPIY